MKETVLRFSALRPVLEDTLITLFGVQLLIFSMYIFVLDCHTTYVQSLELKPPTEHLDDAKA